MSKSEPKGHFSNCSIYDNSGAEIPDAECDCGGVIDDPYGTPEWVKRWEEQPQSSNKHDNEDIEVLIINLEQQIKKYILDLEREPIQIDRLGASEMLERILDKLLVIKINQFINKNQFCGF